MASKGKQTGAAGTYAKALLELATQRQQAEAVGQELRGIGEVVESNPTFLAFLRDPGISNAEHEKMLERVFQGRLSPLVFNTLRVMNAHGRLGLLRELAEQYQEFLDEQTGKIEVDVTVPQELDPQLLEQVRQRVGAALKKEAVVHQYVDESLIGGLVLRIEDKLIDASVRSQLDAMKRRLMESAPR